MNEKMIAIVAGAAMKEALDRGLAPKPSAAYSLSMAKMFNEVCMEDPKTVAMVRREERLRIGTQMVVGLLATGAVSSWNEHELAQTGLRMADALIDEASRA